MEKVTKKKPKIWGTSIVGFGKYRYKYESGREGEWFLTGLSSRKNNVVLYVMSGFAAHVELLKKLGKFKTGSGCLYIKKLEDIDKKTLQQLITDSVHRLSNNGS